MEGSVEKLSDGNYAIRYLGKEYITKHYCESVSDEEIEKLKEEYYRKPELMDVAMQIAKIDAGGTQKNLIEDYYFKDLMSKVRFHHSRWSIEDMWNCHHIVRYFYERTKYNKNIFPDSQDKLKHIETVVRLGGKRVCCKPSNFPINSAREVISKYISEGDNYLDFACGWGIRLLAAMSLNVNYYGIDPNYLLVDRLQELTKLYRRIVPSKHILDIDIRNTVSEKFIPEFEDKMDLAFTSIPYYNLEDYRVGNQSYKEGVSYNDWLNNYIEPTVKNLYKYLKVEGILAINVNNYKPFFTLVEDVYKRIVRNGFNYIESVDLVNITRIKNNNEFNDNDEIIMVFNKEGK